MGLAGIFRSQVASITGDKVDYVQAYTQLDEAAVKLLEQADLVVEQVFDQKQIAEGSSHYTGATIIRVPLVTGNFLYPFGGGSRFVNRSRPGAAFGAWGNELGCSLLDKMIKAGGPPEEIVENYCSTNMAELIDLNRLLEFSIDRQDLRDEKAGMDTHKFIEKNFRTRHLFMTVNHLMPVMSRYIAGKLFPMIASAQLVERAVESIRAPLFSPVYRPLHPSVSKFFGLSYGHENQTYDQSTGEPLTFRQFVDQYVRDEINEDLGASLIKSHSAGSSEAELKEIVDGLRRGLSKSLTGSFLGEVRLAHMLMKLKQPEEAAEALCRAVVLNPTNLGPIIHLAQVQYQIKRYNDAEKTLRAGILRLPEEGQLYNLLHRVLIAQSRPDDSVDALLVCIGLNPKDPALRVTATDLLLRVGRVSEARSVADQALSLMPDEGIVRGAMARVLAREGNLEAAYTETAMGLVSNPADSRLSEQLSSLLLQLGRYDEAVNVSQALLAQGVETPGLHLSLARALKALCRFEEAFSSASRGSILMPGNHAFRVLVEELRESLPPGTARVSETV